MSYWYKDDKAQSGVIISSRIRLARNLKDLPFPRIMSAEVLSELKTRVKNAVEDITLNSDYRLKYIEMDSVPEAEIASMVERHIISPDFAKNCNGRAIAISDDERICIMIGEEDHIRIQVLLPGASVDEAYSIADDIDTLLNEKLDFAFDNRLGYLTECPTNIGTGLRASMMLHLPVCESKGDINTISDAAGKIGLTVRGMYGEGSKASASLYQLSNQITLGISEKNAIENLKAIAEQIVDREKQNRMQIGSVELEDAVFRALGTLKYARLLSCDELMKLISMIKLGIDEGIMDESDLRPIEILIEAQPATVSKKFSLSGPSERDEKRARVIREILKSCN